MQEPQALLPALILLTGSVRFMEAPLFRTAAHWKLLHHKDICAARRFVTDHTKKFCYFSPLIFSANLRVRRTDLLIAARIRQRPSSPGMDGAPSDAPEQAQQDRYLPFKN